MTDPRHLERLARDLYDGRPVSPDPDLRLREVGLGYAVQDRVWGLCGQELAGYKIGLTNRGAQIAMQCDSPIFGRLAPAWIVPSPATLFVDPDHLRIVEPEIVFEIGRDIDGRSGPIDAETVFRSLRAIHGGLELCDTRYDADLEVTAAEIVADNGCADRLVVGPRLEVQTVTDLAAIDVRLCVNGMDEVRGTSASVLENPIEALLSLARHLAACGQQLTAGMLVASGSCAGMTTVPLGSEIRVEFGEGATLATRLLPARDR